MAKKGGIDLDSILDQALDDFDEIESAESAKKASARASKQNAKKKDPTAADKSGNSKEKPTATKESKPAAGDLKGSSAGKETADKVLERTGKETEEKTTGANDAADREVTETLKMIAEAQKGMEGFEAGKFEEVGETMMEDMMQQFESMGDKDDYNEVIDGVMRQLLSRDLMYEPMKQICERFPAWLATNKPTLPSVDYEKYSKMYETFQTLLTTYDTEPDNQSKLMELLFDVQQYGQPPAEIMQDLAPGLMFDEDGMPIMPNMGMPDMAGIPDLGNLPGNGQCTVS